MSVEAELQQSVAYTPLQRMRHSAAHVMAEAVQDLFPGARFAIGPAIEDGFYYEWSYRVRSRPKTSRHRGADAREHRGQPSVPT